MAEALDAGTLDDASAPPSRGAKLIVLAVSTLLSLVLAEVIVRVFHLSKTLAYARVQASIRSAADNNLSGPEGQRYIEHQRMGFKNPYKLTLKPNATVVWDGITSRTNEAGYRASFPFTPRPEAGKRRVIVVGDSVAFGYQVEEEKIFTTLLGHELSKTKPTEVYNFGLGGSDTNSNLFHFRRAINEFAPQVVVYQFGLNDLSPPPGAPPPAGVKALLRKSALYLFAAERYNYLRMRKSAAAAQSSPWAAAAEAASGELAEHATELNKAFAEANQRGIKVLFVFFPYDYQILSHDPSVLRPSQQLQRLIDPRSAGYLDLTPSLQAAPNAGTLLLDDAHLSAEGHRLVTELLAPKIDALLEGKP